MQLRELQLTEEYSGTVYFGDCLHVMAALPSDSVDLIVTSPPYANMRAHTYGGIDHDLYVPWFLERAEQMLRILKTSGSFVLNIKENTVEGQRHTYVLKLILALIEELGFRWVEEYIWHKPDPYPGAWKHRFRDGWERLLHFAKCEDLKINRDAVKVPAAALTVRRYSGQPPDNDRKTWGSDGRHSIRIANMHNMDTVYPSNVLYGPKVVRNPTGHTAVYPEWLPEFFIKLFTDDGDTVLDPFLGSGTTYRVAKRLGRRPLGIELLKDTQMDLGDEDVELIYAADAS